MITYKMTTYKCLDENCNHVWSTTMIPMMCPKCKGCDFRVTDSEKGEMMEAIDHVLIHQVRASKYYDVNRLFEMLPHLHALLESRKHIVERITIERDATSIKELLEMNKIQILQLLGIDP